MAKKQSIGAQMVALRNKKLSPRRRSAIARQAANARWAAYRSHKVRNTIKRKRARKAA